MKIVIHAGMHKTGSSSIQDYMSAADLEGISYASWRSPNHSALFVLLFADEETLFSYHSFRSRGSNYLSRILDIRQFWRDSLVEEMRDSAGKTFVFSAESISHPHYSNAIEPMANFFRQWSDDVNVIAYVRSPLSFANSAFQQRLKGGAESLNVGSLWPSYKKRFAKLEEVFGEKLTLKPYDAERLVDGDVVKDFVSILGAEVKGDFSQKSNSSLSAEAAALLFCQRNVGNGFVDGFEGAHTVNESFIEALRSIGSSRLTISSELWGAVLAKNARDLEWVESRLGEPLVDRLDPNAKAISSESDLLDIALAAQKDLGEVVRKSILGRRDREVEYLARSLDFLREVTNP